MLEAVYNGMLRDSQWINDRGEFELDGRPYGTFDPSDLDYASPNPADNGRTLARHTHMRILTYYRRFLFDPDWSRMVGEALNRSTSENEVPTSVH